MSDTTNLDWPFFEARHRELARALGEAHRADLSYGVAAGVPALREA